MSDSIEQDISDKQRFNEMEIRLTEKEKLVLSRLADAWHSFLDLKKYGDDLEMPPFIVDNSKDFREAIHRAQEIIALRVAKRADPDFWK